MAGDSAAWERSWGEHLHVVKMGANLTTVTATSEAIKRWRAVYKSVVRALKHVETCAGDRLCKTDMKNSSRCQAEHPLLSKVTRPSIGRLHKSDDVARCADSGHPMGDESK